MVSCQAYKDPQGYNIPIQNPNTITIIASNLQGVCEGHLVLLSHLLDMLSYVQPFSGSGGGGKIAKITCSGPA